MYGYPALGGEPLYKSAAISVASRRLPRITQGNLWPSVALLRCVDLNGADRAATRADVPGSRVLPTHITANLQRGSPPGAMCLRHSWATTQIEDEDEDENDLSANALLAPSSITDQVPVLGQIRKTGEKGQCYCDRENQCTDPASDVLGGGREVNPGSLVNTL
jgi:hypothetical protein